MFNVIIFFIVGLILYHVSKYDIKTLKIRVEYILIVLCLGLLFYWLNKGEFMLLVSNFVILNFIFLIAIFFDMGIGDLLLIYAFCPYFLNEDYLKIFLLIFLIATAIWTVYQIDKYNFWHNKKELLRMRFAFCPPICTGFIGFCIYFLYQS